MIFSTFIGINKLCKLCYTALVKYLLSLLIFFISFTSFAEDWILIKKDFECFQERGRSCYIFLAEDKDNETYLSYINIERHAFEEFKLSLYVDYLSSDEYEIFINDEKYSFKNNYKRGYLSKYIEEIITNQNIADGYYSENHPFKTDTFERVFIETDKDKYMIKIWDNLERLEFYWYYKDEDFYLTKI